jgi:N-acetylglutamate synthase/N-acetylornithine aminotransferase
VTEDTPTLLEQARLRNKKPGPVCGVANAMTGDRGREVTELIEACKRREVQFTTATIVLGEAGIELKNDSISRHCRGVCGCRVAA